MDKTTRIKNIIKKFNTYRNIAFNRQIKFMDNIEKQYYKKGNLSTKQVNIALEIIKQNKRHQNSINLSRKMNKNNTI